MILQNHDLLIYDNTNVLIYSNNLRARKRLKSFK